MIDFIDTVIVADPSTGRWTPHRNESGRYEALWDASFKPMLRAAEEAGVAVIMLPRNDWGEQADGDRSPRSEPTHANVMRVWEQLGLLGQDKAAHPFDKTGPPKNILLVSDYLMLGTGYHPQSLRRPHGEEVFWESEEEAYRIFATSTWMWHDHRAMDDYRFEWNEADWRRIARGIEENGVTLWVVIVGKMLAGGKAMLERGQIPFPDYRALADRSGGGTLHVFTGQDADSMGNQISVQIGRRIWPAQVPESRDPQLTGR